MNGWTHNPDKQSYLLFTGLFFANPRRPEGLDVPRSNRYDPVQGEAKQLYGKQL